MRWREERGRIESEVLLLPYGHFSSLGEARPSILSGVEEADKASARPQSPIPRFRHRHPQLATRACRDPPRAADAEGLAFDVASKQAQHDIKRRVRIR